ncbi:uncharacterized protein LOC123706206 [Colias croceus]|uniref:uncharacterized protein LOC123698144 n=1 Tax=Colias crocea TaxID=72248 RepID=UPI001E27F38E|nr:uncharacterized protein LOC123698144 [Colias croceus]XP_045511334.1 uncharacterized protein LOC123706206 [Colias croceus]
MDHNQPSTSSGCHGITFTKTEKGRRMLLRGGYMYTFHRETKIGTVWRCTDRSCSAIIKISENDTSSIRILHEAAHKCQPNFVKTEIIKTKNLCKKAAVSSSTPMPQLFEEVFKPEKDAGYDLLNALPKFSNFSRSLYNVRNHALNVPKTHFTKCEDVIIPTKYIDGFLLFDDDSDPKNRIIAFCTEAAREVIPNVHTYFLDGTFSSCCTPFYQLYCIHGDVNSDENFTNIVPLIYVLMPNKQERSYERLFISLKEHLPNWAPLTMIVDFEVAVINVIKNVFPGVKLQGCNFHFKQALAKKAHALNMNSIDEKRHLALCAALAHVKKEDIEDAWLCIMEDAPQNEAVTKFNDYFVTQWLENKSIEFIWNVHGYRHRTINLAEAWHKRLNNMMHTKKPRMLQFLETLKKEADYVDVKIKKMKLAIPLNLRTRRSIAYDKELRTILDNYNNMSLAEILKKLSYLQHFKDM